MGLLNNFVYSFPHQKKLLHWVILETMMMRVIILIEELGWNDLWYRCILSGRLSKSVHAWSVTSDSCEAMDCSPPGSSVCGIFQARILEWVAIPFSRGLSQPRGQTHTSYIGRHIFFFTTEPPGKITEKYIDANIHLVPWEWNLL